MFDFGSLFNGGSSDMFAKLFDPAQVDAMSQQMAGQADPSAFGGLTSQLMNGPQDMAMGAGGMPDASGGFANMLDPRQPAPILAGMPPPSLPPMANDTQPPAPVESRENPPITLMDRAKVAMNQTTGQLTPEQIKALNGMMPTRPQDQNRQLPPPSAPLARGGQMPGNMAQVQAGGGRPQARSGFAGILGR